MDPEPPAAADVAPPPTLVWSKTVVDILDALPEHVRSTWSYLGPANSVLHVASPSMGGSGISRAVLPFSVGGAPRRSSRFASGAHKRIRLQGESGGQSVVMNFEENTIHAGCNSPPTAVCSAFTYLLYAGRGNHADLFKRGYSLSVPNIVVSARTSFPVPRDFLKSVPWTNWSEKFPGFAVIHPELRNNICPELYPSRSSPPKPMNLVIPGLQDVQKDLPPTLTTLARLLAPCRPGPE